MNKETYLRHFEENRQAILDAAPRNLDASVRGCPGWDVAALAGHMGVVYTFWLRWIRQRPQGPTADAQRQFRDDRERLLPGFAAWADNRFPASGRPDGLLEFTRSTGSELQRELECLSPDEPVWTFVPSRQNAAFIFRRIAQETGVHRWDAENAVGIDRDIDRELARDGVDEMLFALPEIVARDPDAPNIRSGQRVRLVETATQNVWLLTFEQNGMRRLEDDGKPVDLEVSGSASNLLLFIIGRRRPDEVRISGDRALASQWGDLAGRF